MHEKYWAEAVDCGRAPAAAAEDERVSVLYMWHVQYVMTECVACGSVGSVPIQTQESTRYTRLPRCAP